MDDNEYKCEVCKGVFEKVQNENWNDHIAQKEYEAIFGNSVYANTLTSVICDDCFNRLMEVN
jgi:uncharacterized protein with PIN domain